MDKKSPPGQRSADPAGVKRGGYLLFRFRSTIGVAGFNFSVRNGKRWSPRAIATLMSLQGLLPVAGCRLCKVKKEVWKLICTRFTRQPCGGGTEL